MELLVVDSSALITLAAAEALALLALWRHPVRTVSGVYRETVEAGLAKGYPDARSIARCFEERLIQIQDPRRAEDVPGISHTDSLVLRLAEESRAARMLINDRTLLRRAEQRRLQAWLTVEFIWDLYKSGKISRKRLEGLLASFQTRGRYSEEFLRAFLLGR